MTKYRPLYDHLFSCRHAGRVRLSFAEVASILGGPLPRSALVYRTSLAV